MDKSSKAILGIIVVLVVIWAGYALMKKPAGDTNQPAANTPAATADTGKKEPVKIGFLGPLTGDGAAYGEPMRDMTEMAVAEINAAGGINGADLQVVYEDGKCNGKDGTSAMQKLVNVEKVQVVLGGVCSGETIPAAKVADENKVLMFTAGASSPELAKAGPYFFRDYPSDATQGKVLADVAYNKKSWKKVAIIQEQTDYALGNKNAFEEAYKGYGGTTVVERFATETKDLRTPLAKLKAENPDALFVVVQTPASADRVFKQLSDLGWKPNMMGIDIIGDADVLAKNGAAIEGLILARFTPNPEAPKMKKMLENYKTKYGKDFPYQGYGATQYDAVYILAMGLREVGNDGTKMKDWLDKFTGYDGASGRVEFDADGERKAGHSPQVIQGGKVVDLQ